MLTNSLKSKREYLLVSDFDQTLSYNDSGLVLSQMLGISDFRQRVAGLADIHLLQQGGELAYLILHDPEFRCVRKEHLIEVGRRVLLKANIKLLLRFLDNLEGIHFCFHVLSSAPQEINLAHSPLFQHYHDESVSGACQQNLCRLFSRHAGRSSRMAPRQRPGGARKHAVDLSTSL